jgi:hypothetical protein
VVVGNSALRRLYAFLCALQIGLGVLPRLRQCAFPSPSFRPCPRDGGCLELVMDAIAYTAIALFNALNRGTVSTAPAPAPAVSAQHDGQGGRPNTGAAR